MRFTVFCIALLLAACGGGNSETDINDEPTFDEKLKAGKFSINTESIVIDSGESLEITVDADLEDGATANLVFDKVACRIESSSHQNNAVLESDEKCRLTGVFPGEVSLGLVWLADESVELEFEPVSVSIQPFLVGTLDSATTQQAFPLTVPTGLSDVFYKVDQVSAGQTYKLTYSGDFGTRFSLWTLESIDSRVPSCRNTVPGSGKQLSCGIRAQSESIYFFLSGLSDIGQAGELLIAPDTDVFKTDGVGSEFSDRQLLQLDVPFVGHVAVNELGNNQSYYRLNLDENLEQDYQVVLSDFSREVAMKIQWDDSQQCKSTEFVKNDDQISCVISTRPSFLNITINGNNTDESATVFDSLSAEEGEASYTLLVKALP